MIPKKIHYCWFGKGKKTELVLKCIKSWEKYCPGYEIIEWNEENFNINFNQYCKEAYKAQKYAFVSDVARLYVIYTQGGIYMDTDVELLKPLDDVLEDKAFLGFEDEEWISTGIIGGEKGNEIFKNLIRYYDKLKFIQEDGSYNTTTNVVIITNMLEKMGLNKNNTYQKIGELIVYPKDYFSPLDSITGILSTTKNTYAVHWFSKSWLDKKSKLKNKVATVFRRIFGRECLNWLKKWVK